MGRQIYFPGAFKKKVKMMAHVVSSAHSQNAMLKVPVMSAK